jgi:LacI family transcriptional regulator
MPTGKRLPNRPAPTPQGAATIVDVARVAAVSVATVSRALSRPERVRPELVARVRSVATRLGYVPHRAARALVSRRSATIGAVVPTVDNAIFAKAIQSLQRALDERGYRLLLAFDEYDLAREAAQVRAMVEHGVDGLVLVGGEHDGPTLDLLRSRGVPFVYTWMFAAAGADPCIGFDNRRSMVRLTHHLADLGHRRFAVVSGITRGNDRAAERLAGVRDALAARGIDLPPANVVERPYGIAEGRSALGLLLAQRPAPTAVVCGNDVLAFGVLFEALARGIDVPRSLSITGFDDLDLSAQLTPSLTTMRVPSAEMGRRAAEFLLSRIGGDAVPDKLELEAELIVRGTTAPPAS